MSPTQKRPCSTRLWPRPWIPAPTQEQIDTYSAYTEAYGANYCTMIAMMDTVTDALTTGAQVK